MRNAAAQGCRAVGGAVVGVSVQLIAQGSSCLAGLDVFAPARDGRGWAIAGAFAGALIAFAFGESVRRGAGWSRQVVVALGLTLAALGVASLPGSVGDLEHGFVLVDGADGDLAHGRAADGVVDARRPFAFLVPSRDE